MNTHLKPLPIEKQRIQLSESFSIPLLDYATQGNAILGIRDSGKSYSATWFAERLMDANVPFIAFDPIGVWRSLKTPGEGANAKGYSVVVAGQNGDIDLTPQSTEALIEAAMAENVSVIIDLYSMPHLSKAEKRRMVETAVNVLLYKNESLRHLFIEEAAEFCPQRLRPEFGSVYAAIEQLARMGGNRYLGYTLINQRAEEVNKAVLELCDCLLLHRQKGKNSLDSLRKWLDLTDVAQGREIISSLPTLRAGECWVWVQQSNNPVRIQMPKKRSAHPDRRTPQSRISKPVGVATDVAPFVERMKAHLSQLATPVSKSPLRPHPNLENASLRSQLAELQRQLEEAHRQPAREIRVVSEDQIQALQSAADSLKTSGQSLVELSSKILSALDEVRSSQAQAAKIPLPRASLNPTQAPHGPLVDHSSGAQRSGGGIRRMLTALAQRPGLSKRQLGLRAGLSSNSGTFRNYMAVLRRNGWIIENSSDDIRLSEEGLTSLGEYEPLPTGRALLQYWLAQLGAGPGRMLQVLAQAYPAAISKEELSSASGMTNSGTFRNYLAELRGYELVTGRGSELKASDELFD